MIKTVYTHVHKHLAEGSERDSSHTLSEVDLSKKVQLEIMWLDKIGQKDCLAFCMLVPSADNRCKQFGPRSGLTKGRARSGSKLVNTQTVLLKEFFEKIKF